MWLMFLPVSHIHVGSTHTFGHVGDMLNLLLLEVEPAFTAAVLYWLDIKACTASLGQMRVCVVLSILT